MGAAVIWCYIELFGEARLKQVERLSTAASCFCPTLPQTAALSCTAVAVARPARMRCCQTRACSSAQHGAPPASACQTACPAPVLCIPLRPAPSPVPPHTPRPCTSHAGGLCGPGAASEHGPRLEVGFHRLLRPGLPHPPAGGKRTMLQGCAALRGPTGAARTRSPPAHVGPPCTALEPHSRLPCCRRRPACSARWKWTSPALPGTTAASAPACRWLPRWCGCWSRRRCARVGACLPADVCAPACAAVCLCGARCRLGEPGRWRPCCCARGCCVRCEGAVCGSNRRVASACLALLCPPADPAALGQLMADHTTIDWRPLLPRIQIPCLNIGGHAGGWMGWAGPPLDPSLAWLGAAVVGMPGAGRGHRSAARSLPSLAYLAHTPPLAWRRHSFLCCTVPLPHVLTWRPAVAVLWLRLCLRSGPPVRAVSVVWF